MSLLLRRWKRPLLQLQQLQLRRSFKTSAYENQLKVYRRPRQDGSVGVEFVHSDIPFPIRWEGVLALGGIFVMGWLSYQSCYIVPAGRVGVVIHRENNEINEVLQPGWWYVPGPAATKFQQWSTHQQSVVTSRVPDSLGRKVFATVLVQYQISDIQVFWEHQQEEIERSKKNQSLHSKIEQWLFHDTSLEGLVTRHVKSIIQDVLAQENAVDLHLGTAAKQRSTLEVSKRMTTTAAQQSTALPGITISSIIILDLEMPHWVHDHIDKSIQQNWDKVLEKRQQKNQKIQQDGQLKLQQLIERELRPTKESSNNIINNNNGKPPTEGAK